MLLLNHLRCLLLRCIGLLRPCMKLELESRSLCCHGIVHRLPESGGGLAEIRQHRQASEGSGGVGKAGDDVGGSLRGKNRHRQRHGGGSGSLRD